MAGEYIFTMSGMSKTFASNKVLDNINLCFYHDAKIGIVGENGSGKSTLLRIMAQEDREIEGQAEPLKGIRIGFVPQEPQLEAGHTVRQSVETAFGLIKKLIDEFNEVSTSMSNPMSDDEMQKAMDKMARLQDAIDTANGWEMDRQVSVAMDALVLPPDDQKVETLSGGEARRVALCRVLLEKPDMVLLDEPTNHLDAETVQWLEETLKDYPGNVIISTHDRYFLDRITKWILELDGGRGIPFEGNYSSWLEQKAERLVRQEKSGSRLGKVLRAELEWIRMKPSAHSQENKTRVSDYEKLASKQINIRDDGREIQIAPGPHLGNVVIKAKGVSKAYGKNVLFENMDFEIPPGAIVGVIGPNGTGKTTLFKMIVGEDQPDAGTITIGKTVLLSYVDQHRDALNDVKTVYEEISEGQEFLEIDGRTVNPRAYAASFNFRGQDQQKKVGSLSGGERNRVHMAKLLRRGGNVLLLDEPTNDLDVATLRSLETALLDFNGCVVVISHDRFFLNRICTHLLVFEGNKTVRWFEGNFEDYQEVRRKELGGREENRRSKYKKLTIH